MSEWISVKDAVPVNMVDVLTWRSSDKEHWFPMVDCYSDYSNDWCEKSYYVTHWQPIVPPKE